MIEKTDEDGVFMKAFRRYSVFLSSFTIIFIFFCACSVLFHKTSVKCEHTDDLTLIARFERQDRSALTGMEVTVRFAQETHTAPLSEDGEAAFSHVPKAGELTLSLTDSERQEVSRITLRLAEAAVTDASTDENGVGHISVKAEAERLTLLLTLDESDRLYCGLYLNELQ